MMIANIIIAILAIYALIVITKIFVMVKDIDKAMFIAMMELDAETIIGDYRDSGCSVEIYRNGVKVDDTLAVYLVDPNGRRAFFEAVNAEKGENNGRYDTNKNVH